MNYLFHSLPRHIRFLVFLLTVISTTLAHATTFTVTSTSDAGTGGCTSQENGDGCTLREAVGAASDNSENDHIVFDAAVFGTPQVITLNGTQLTLAGNGSLSIDGSAGVSISSNDQSRVFWVNPEANVTLSGLTITRGRITQTYEGGGAGIRNQGTLKVLNCTFEGNHATSPYLDGGAILSYGSVLTVQNSTFNGNSAGSGGALYTLNSSTVSNSTFTDNHANSNGGAINNSGLLTLEFCTITRNYGAQGGISSFGETGTSTRLRHTIVVDNPLFDGGPGVDIGLSMFTGNTFQSQGYNLIGIGTAASVFTQPGDQIGVTAQQANLGPLKNNGGATQTIAPLGGSIAINAGDPAYNASNQTDQRGLGYPRLFAGAVDIGALEVQSIPPTTLSLNRSSVLEKQALGTYIGTFSTTDPDLDKSFTYSLVNGVGDGDNASFAIGGSSLRSNAIFDVQAKSSYNIRVRTTDSAGLFFEKTFTITVLEATPPKAFISSPLPNQKILRAEFTGNIIRGTASDNKRVTIVKVRLSRKRAGSNQYWNGQGFINTPSTVNATLTGSTSVKWLLSNLPPASDLDTGLYQVEAYALDAAGNKSTTASASFSLGTDFIYPSVVLSTPANNSRVDINDFGPRVVSGTASDNAGVTNVKVRLQRKRGTQTFYWNGTSFTTTSTTVDATILTPLGQNVAWSLDSTIPANQLDNGVYSIYALATDAAGNTTTSSVRSFNITGIAANTVASSVTPTNTTSAGSF